MLEFLGQYDDPDKVRELLQAREAHNDVNHVEGLARVSGRLQELETGMLNDLDRLDRGVITEAEYTKRAEVRRQEEGSLQARKDDLAATVSAQRSREALIQEVPMKVRSFVEDFQDMDVPKAKALLQTLLKSAHVWSDGNVELEFRE